MGHNPIGGVSLYFFLVFLFPKDGSKIYFWEDLVTKASSYCLKVKT